MSKTDRGLAPMLKGVAWDHRRCWGPLEGMVAQSTDGPLADPLAGPPDHGGPEIQWGRRSLFSFGEGDLGEFAATNDLIIYDHPFTGDVANRGLMLDLRQFLGDDEIRMLEDNQVGDSYKSYHFEGGIFALPIDSAATMAAWRPDLMAGLGAVPDSLNAVYELSARARKKGQWVAWAAKPTDLFCSYIAMIASLGVNIGHEDGPFVPRNISADILGEMKKLRAIVHPKSFQWNPIQLFDHMVSEDDVVYVPFAFNYVNYCRVPRRCLKFGSSPRMVPDHRARGILGGAGIGVSAASQNPEKAFRYAMRLIDPGWQASGYVANGGQPGMRSAWMSDACDRMTNGFFSGCRAAMDNAFLRPTIPGFVAFFHEATHRLTAAVTGDVGHADFWEWLTSAYDMRRHAASGKSRRG